MTRAQQTISIALLLSSVQTPKPDSSPFSADTIARQLYLACFLNLIPIFPAKIQDDIIPVLPLWSLVSFGSYLLFKLGWGVFTFNDVPMAQEELMKEIELARVDLKRGGVDVD